MTKDHGSRRTEWWLAMWQHSHSFFGRWTFCTQEDYETTMTVVKSSSACKCRTSTIGILCFEGSFTAVFIFPWFSQFVVRFILTVIWSRVHYSPVSVLTCSTCIGSINQQTVLWLEFLSIVLLDCCSDSSLATDTDWDLLFYRFIAKQQNRAHD